MTRIRFKNRQDIKNGQKILKKGSRVQGYKIQKSTNVTSEKGKWVLQNGLGSQI